MRITLTHAVETVVDNGFNREVLRITPKLNLELGMRGSIEFSTWEAWLDEPETIKRQQDAALASAEITLATFCKTPELFQR